MEVFQWLQRLGFEEYTDSFGENRIDEEVLPLLTDEDLKTLGVHALGDRKKILKAIAELMPDAANEGYSQQRPQSTWATPKPTPKRRPSKPKPQQATPSEAERRQLTVMFLRSGRINGTVREARSGRPARHNAPIPGHGGRMHRPL